MDFKLYLDTLGNLLWWKYYNNQLLDKEGKVIKDKDKASIFIDEVLLRFEIRGAPDPASPYHYEVMRYVTPLLQAQEAERTRAETEETRRWEEEMGLAREKETRAGREWQAEFGLGQERFAWQKQQEDWTRGLEQTQWADALERAQRETQTWRQVAEAQKMTGQIMGGGWMAGNEAAMEAQRQLKEQQYDTEIQRVMDSLRADPQYNWYKIQELQAERAKNPYRATPSGEGQLWQYAESALKEAQRLAPLAAEYKLRMQSGDIKPGDLHYQAAESVVKAFNTAMKQTGELNRAVTAEKAAWQASPLYQAGGGAVTGGFPRWGPTTEQMLAQEEKLKPKLPTEIEPWVAGGAIGGAVVTPSGQQWMRMPESTKAMLAGYQEQALGGRWGDIMGRMTSMLPRTPSLGTQWRPARQMA